MWLTIHHLEGAVVIWERGSAARISVDIDAPPERVWQVMSDIERWHEWTASVTSVRLLTQGPLAVGTRAVVKQPKLPPARWLVTALEPGRGFTWVSRAPGLAVTGHHYVAQRAEGGSTATLTLDFGGPLGGLWARVTRAITERYLTFEAEGLRHRSEGV